MSDILSRFGADKVSVSGPKVDGSYRISFDVGQYQLENIKDLVTVIDTALDITVRKAE